MAIIAKSTITLTSVSDAYSVSLQPSNITIPTDKNRENPVLTNASTIIRLLCGSQVKRIVNCVVSASSCWTEGVPDHSDCELVRIDESTYKLSITNPGTDELGWREISVTEPNGAVLTARFAYALIKEASLPLWVSTWDTNCTEITGDHIATPAAFIGSKNALGNIDGIYLGSGIPNHSQGLYGFKNLDTTAFLQGNIESRYVDGAWADGELYHFNQEGASIGGWDITTSGIQTSDGLFQIQRDGEIYTKDSNGEVLWSIAKNGKAKFAGGDVTLRKGASVFKGEIQANTGNIGGWNIRNNALTNGMMAIDGVSKFIGFASARMIPSSGMTPQEISFNASQYGGLVIFRNSDVSYGLKIYSPATANIVGLLNTDAKEVVSLGSTNHIAGWRIDENTFSLGVKVNNHRQHTEEASHITIGDNGLRGNTWYFDSDGVIDLGKGLFHISEGGVATLACFKVNGDALWFGDELNDNAGEFALSNTLTLSRKGLRGSKWRLEADGSGAIAGGNIEWGTDGTLRFSDKISSLWNGGISASHIMSYGAILYRNPDFIQTIPLGVSWDSAQQDRWRFNGTSVYLQSLNTIELMETPKGANTPALSMVSTKWNTKTDCRIGGFGFATQTKSNGKYVCRFVAKIPIDWQVDVKHNACGEGAKGEWLTPTEGTGDWQEYLYQLNCGKTGVFSTAFFFNLKPAGNKWGESDDTLAIVVREAGKPNISYSEVKWAVSYATVYEANVADKCTVSIDANGVYTGLIRADQISAGQIDSRLINVDEILSNGAKWALKKDGSGYLASGNITWEANGDMVVKGDMVIGHLDFCVASNTPEAIPNGSLLYNVEKVVLPEVPAGTFRSIKIYNPKDGEIRGGIMDAPTTSLVITGVNDGVYVQTPNAVWPSKSATIVDGGKNSKAYYELLGVSAATTNWSKYNKDVKTVWKIIPLTTATENLTVHSTGWIEENV